MNHIIAPILIGTLATGFVSAASETGWLTLNLTDYCSTKRQILIEINAYPTLSFGKKKTPKHKFF